MNVQEKFQLWGAINQKYSDRDLKFWGELAYMSKLWLKGTEIVKVKQIKNSNVGLKFWGSISDKQSLGKNDKNRSSSSFFVQNRWNFVVASTPKEYFVKAICLI